MSQPNPNMLLVEGPEDKRIIPSLMKQFIPWGDASADRPVEIVDCGGVDKLLASGAIEARIKTSGLRALGIIVDADQNADSRWQTIRLRCRDIFPDFPELPQPEGLILTNKEGLRIGVWVMPDNQASGMLETFLAESIPQSQQDLKAFADQCCADSKTHGAPYNDAHVDKAKLHTWLAWQNPPGQQVHVAVLHTTLGSKSPQSDNFVNWFCKLFSLDRSPDLPELPESPG